MHATPTQRTDHGRRAPASRATPARVSRKPAPANRTWLRLATHVPGAGRVQRYKSGAYSYGNTEDCPGDFMKNFVWPGHNQAYRMVTHALYGLCGALYGKKTARNEDARQMLRKSFGSEWKKESQVIYDTLWKLRSALVNAFTYDCDTTEWYYCEWDPPDGTEWANTGGGSEINLCYQNLERADVAKFAQVAIHETGHRLGMGHGSDDESEDCKQETGDTHCFAELAEGMWKWVEPNYTENMGDHCLAPGPTEPELWDE